MAVRYTFAVGTTAEWAASALILALGQPGWDRTLKQIRIGDGASLWTALPVYGGSGGGGGAVTTVNGQTGDVVIGITEISGLLSALQTAQFGLTTFNQQSGTGYTLALADRGGMVQMTNGSANAITVPANLTVAFPLNSVINLGTATSAVTTITPAAGVTINSASGLRMTTQWAQASLLKTATNTWWLSGNTVV